MARLLIALSCVLALPAAGQATGAQQIVFNAPVPCALLCPYWSPGADTSCAREPLTVPGSWADVRLVAPELPAGKRGMILRAGLNPSIDYDGFICHIVDPGTAHERWELHGSMATPIVPDACHFQGRPIGCDETAMVMVTPGDTYVFRAFNFADGPTCQGWYDYMAF